VCLTLNESPCICIMYGLQKYLAIIYYIYIHICIIYYTVLLSIANVWYLMLNIYMVVSMKWLNSEWKVNQKVFLFSLFIFCFLNNYLLLPINLFKLQFLIMYLILLSTGNSDIIRPSCTILYFVIFSHVLL